MTLAIEASGLVKAFGDTRAVDGVDLAARPGAVYGFLGPNGAGKTTTIREEREHGVRRSRRVLRDVDVAASHGSPCTRGREWGGGPPGCSASWI
jgi:ABC-type lipopolysaccharide export system ATPase subunit